jgi:hypothetical protein
VDGADQSEVWGAFRVARRARPLFAELGPLEGSRLSFRGSHDGYRRLRGRVVHERRVTADLRGKWDIEDLLTGSGEHDLESYIHLHPDCVVRGAGDRRFLVKLEGREVARILVTCDMDVELMRGWYCPEFGRKLDNTVLVLRGRRRLPVKMSYTIMKA